MSDIFFGFNQTCIFSTDITESPVHKLSKQAFQREPSVCVRKDELRYETKLTVALRNFAQNVCRDYFFFFTFY